MMKNFEKIYNIEQEDVVEFSVSDELKTKYEIFNKIDQLPEGFCVIGGAARSLAFSHLNENCKGEVLPVRDIDLAYISDEFDENYLNEVSKEFSYDDFSHNHGCQKIEGVDEYMNSRDFTMNQVMYKDGNLVMSKRAIEDIRRGIIRPCEDRVGEDDFYNYDEDYWYEDTYHKMEVSSRIALKACLQKTILKERIPDIKIDQGVECDEDFYYSYPLFQLALCLQKSFEYGGEKTANNFINEIYNSDIFKDWSIRDILGYDNRLPKNIYDIMIDINKIREENGRDSFDFRNEAQDFFMKETNDREYCAELEKWQWLEDRVENTGKFRGSVKI